MKNALITGADKGIGFAVAAGLGRSGNRILVGSRDAGRGDDAVRELREQGIEAELVELDVTDPVGVRLAAGRVRERHDHLDILVNNAGILPEATATERSDGPLDLALFRATFDTNLLGAVTVLQEFLPLLEAAPAGRIVNVSTTMGSLADQADSESPFHGMIVPAYQSSKAALNSVTIGLSKALADTQVKVNSICPGWVKTDLAGDENKATAPLSPDEGAEIVIRMAEIGEDGPSGGFFDRNGPVRW